MAEKILELKNLKTSFYTHLGEVQAVRGVSYDLEEGSILGIVGESGSGKSVTSLSIMRLIDTPGKIKEGEILFQGTDLAQIPEDEMRDIRGSEISMIFQDPMTSLNPVFTIQNQMVEVIRAHIKDPNDPKKPISKQDAIARAINYLELVGIPEPAERIKQYPHQFSGGMRQRALIAMALSCEPKLLIADEPTTALDVTIQAQILELLKELQHKTNTSIIFITHDLGVIAELCTNVVVMYGGMMMEKGTVEEIFYSPKHPYTQGLHKSVPKDVVGQKERLVPIEGSPPDLLNPPVGCPFAPRCDHAMKICLEKSAPLYKISDTQVSSCWLLDEAAPAVEGFRSEGGAK
jgi:oligopeptide transport system ATP-binding protein